MLMDRILDDADFPIVHARPLGPRLSIEERRALLPAMLKHDDTMFETTLTLMGPVLGEAPLSALLASPGYGALKSTVENALGGEDAQRPQAAKQLEATLGRVALLIDVAAAVELTKRLTAWGVSPADPILDLLHLNAALEKSP